MRRELLINGVLSPDDIDGPDGRFSFEVRREPRRLRLTVHAPADEPRLAAITKSAHEALRRFDQWAPVIDVVVAHP